MKNKILTTLLTFTFLLGACQEMPWKIKKEQAKDDEKFLGCTVLAFVCEMQANTEDTKLQCVWNQMQCYSDEPLL